MGNKRKKTVLFTGCSGFPFGSAAIQRQLQLANALTEANYNVLVLNDRGYHSKSISKRESLKVHGYFNDIEYIYCSLLPFKPENFVVRNLLKLIGKVNQVFIILYYRFFKNGLYFFNNTIEIKKLKFYYYFSKILNIQLVYDYVEIIGSLGHRDKNTLEEVKNTFDYNFHKYTDKVIVISDYLEGHLKMTDPKKTQIKIPPIIDFTYFDQIKIEKKVSPFLLFCGSIVYVDVMKFIITVFINSSAVKYNFKLKLVINGSQDKINELKEYLVENKIDKWIEISSQLTYYDLVSNYKSAKALIIPVGNSLQDQARFPFKISEYTASKRPIITSNSGAIKEFFIDGDNAFVAKADDIDSFVDKFNKVIEQPDLADEIGLNGYKLGKKVFNYKSYSNELLSFLSNS